MCQLSWWDGYNCEQVGGNYTKSDPLNPRNHRGITLTSIFLKRILNRTDLHVLLSLVGFPHTSQTVYQHGACMLWCNLVHSGITSHIFQGWQQPLCLCDFEMVGLYCASCMVVANGFSIVATWHSSSSLCISGLSNAKDICVASNTAWQISKPKQDWFKSLQRQMV